MSECSSYSVSVTETRTYLGEDFSFSFACKHNKQLSLKKSGPENACTLFSFYVIRESIRLLYCAVVYF